MGEKTVDGRWNGSDYPCSPCLGVSLLDANGTYFRVDIPRLGLKLYEWVDQGTSPNSQTKEETSPKRQNHFETHPSILPVQRFPSLDNLEAGSDEEHSIHIYGHRNAPRLSTQCQILSGVFFLNLFPALSKPKINQYRE